MSYRLEIPYPEAETLCVEPLASPPCLDTSTARCVPNGPDDPVRLAAPAGYIERCIYCRRELLGRGNDAAAVG